MNSELIENMLIEMERGRYSTAEERAAIRLLIRQAQAGAKAMEALRNVETLAASEIHGEGEMSLLGMVYRRTSDALSECEKILAGGTE